MTARYDNIDGRMRGRKLMARRERKWIEAGGRCAMCNRLLSLNAKPHEFELDHIEALKADGGNGEDTDNNTQVLCCGPEGCHRKKTAQDMRFRERPAVGPDGAPEGWS